MFKITPIQTKSRQRDICELFGTEYRPEAFAYILFDHDTGDVMGMSQFEILGEEGYIYDLREAPDSKDNEAMFILGRQTMNFIDLCGAHACRAPIGVGDERLMSAIGFKLLEGEYFSDMTGMFDGKCDGHAVKLD
ncbi:MAG: hypothetical protein IJE25_08830 [Clostridia bacterium]|nr:hypothetical protein [Clostridia bacterium]